MPRRPRHPLPGLVSLLAAALAAGCGPPGGTAGGSANLLANPGFEAERDGWAWHEDSEEWHDFRIVEAPVHSGRRALHLLVEQAAGTPRGRAGVYGVYQELRPERFPERIGGFYRVDRWEKSDEALKLYLQVVAIVWGDPRTSLLVPPGRLGSQNYQLRYYLGGLSAPAIHLRNAHVVFESTAPPRLGEWTRFELPLRRDVQRLWAGPPERYDSLHVLFEARWDGLPLAAGVRADVYFDDLFVE